MLIFCRNLGFWSNRSESDFNERKRVLMRSTWYSGREYVSSVLRFPEHEWLRSLAPDGVEEDYDFVASKEETANCGVLSKFLAESHMLFLYRLFSTYFSFIGNKFGVSQREHLICRIYINVSSGFFACMRQVGQYFFLFIGWGIWNWIKTPSRGISESSGDNRLRRRLNKIFL